jgi:PAS domain S-box-containing protein
MESVSFISRSEITQYPHSPATMTSPHPVITDPARLAALVRTGLLDSEAEVAYDRLTRMAARIFQVPVAIISLIDADRQFLKSAQGLPEPIATERQTPLSHSFCQHVVTSRRLLQVNDAPAHPLVCDNYSTVNMGIRAYLGAPLMDAEGFILGAFGVVDITPRDWTEEDRERIIDFAAMAMAETELRIATVQARAQARAAHNAELEHRASADRMQNVLDRLQEVVFQVDNKGEWVYLNAAWEKITGYSVKETFGRSFREFLLPEDAARSAETLKRYATGEIRESIVETRLLTKSGDIRWCEASSRVILDENGAFSGVTGTLTDVTERRYIDEKLAEGEARFRTVVENLGEGLLLTDLDNTIQYVNRRMGEMAGFRPEEMEGYKAHKLLSPVEEWDRMTERNQERAVGQSERYETRIRRATGELMWVEVHAAPYCPPGSDVIGTMSAVLDITERKRSEEQLRALTEELTRSNQALQDFASVASHDLQEPLRKILTFGDRLKTRAGDTLSPDGRDYLERMLSAAGRMQSLIQDLLSYARVTSKAQPFTEVKLNDVLNGVLGDLEAQILRTGGTVVVPTALPIVMADQPQMRQLLQNLIGNALKFSREGVPPRVDIEWEELRSGSYCLSVQDNGIGFEEKYAERVFEVFERLHARTEYEGTGMGLAICRKIVERHGGSIRAIGTPGEGATFIIELPQPVSAAQATDTVNLVLVGEESKEK